MAVVKLYDLAQMGTSTTGTGSSLTLTVAISGFLTFALAGVADGETVRYQIRDGANSEVGTGVYTLSSLNLTRNVSGSTNSNARISLTANAQISIGALAADFRQIYLDDGTVSLPSLTFGSDPDSGIWRIGANNIGIGVNGAKVIDIGTAGIVLTGTATISTVVLPTATPSASSVDASNSRITVANNANANLPINGGLIELCDTSLSGGVSLWLLDTAVAVLVSQAGSAFAASTTTPAAGKASVAYSGGVAKVYNALGGSVNFSVYSIKSQ